MTMTKQIVTDELLYDFRKQLEILRSDHIDLLRKAEGVSPRIMELYHSIWDSDEQLFDEFNMIQEIIRLSDFLAYKPK